MVRFVLLAGLLLAPPALAQVPGDLTVSGHIAGVSQYRFRGIALSDEDVALQGSLTASHVSGLYAGTWGSTLAGPRPFGGGDFELDLYGGYRAELGLVELDVGLLWYLYPGTEGTDFVEPYASLSAELGPARGTVGLNWAPEQDAIGGEGSVYLYGDLSSGLPGTPFTVRAHLGRTEGDSALAPGGSYFDWLLGLDATWRALTLGVAYVDTDYGGEAAAIGIDRDLVDSAIVFSVGARF